MATIILTLMRVTEYYSANESDDSNQDPRIKILSAVELELMFVGKEFLNLSGVHLQRSSLVWLAISSTDSIKLCDYPGRVFPQFTSTV